MRFLQDKSKVLRVPLTCLIDYCGFRFLCEYELPGKTKNSDSQRFESKREISEKINPEFYQKCYNLFNISSKAIGYYFNLKKGLKKASAQ